MTKVQGDILLEASDLVKSFVGGDGSELVVLDRLSLKILNHETIRKTVSKVAKTWTACL